MEREGLLSVADDLGRVFCVFSVWKRRFYPSATVRSPDLLPLLQNRELQIMRKLDHCNIVRLRYFFYSSGEKVSMKGLNLSCTDSTVLG